MAEQERQKTTHLKLIKPRYDEDADIKDINDNMDIIDAAFVDMEEVVAPAFVQATANAAETYVMYDGDVYYLPNGHEANVAWANTTKTLTNIGEQLKLIKQNAGAQIDDTAGSGVTNKVWSANKIVSALSDLLKIVAPAFAQATANDAGAYVVYENELYYLPDGHTSGTTWANTTKTKKDIGEVLMYLKENAGAQIDDLAGAGDYDAVWSADKTTGELTRLLSVVAPPFVKATANAEGSYVTYEGELYYLPDGHTANTTWASTTKTKKSIGEVLAYLKENAGAQIDDTAGIGDDDVVWSADKVAETIEYYTTIVDINFGTVNSLPATVYDDRIVSTMRVDHCDVGNPDVFETDPTLTIEDGVVTLSGEMTNGMSTSLIVYLAHNPLIAESPVVIDTTLLVRGAAADAQAVGTALNQKLAKPSISGTNGQVLRTNGSGVVYWDDDANQEDIVGAVEDWLDEHPEATTTIEDGAVTFAKLHESLQGKVEAIDQKAPAIIEENTTKYSDSVSILSLKVQGPVTHNVSLFNGQDIIKDVAKKLRFTSSDQNFVVSYEEPNTIFINGTASNDFWTGLCSSTSSYDINLATSIPANSVMKFRVFISGTVTGSLPYCNIKINDVWEKYSLSPDSSTGVGSFDFTTTEAVNKIQLQTKIIKDSVCSNVRLSFTCVVDAEEITIPAFNNSVYTVSPSLVSNWSKVSSIPANHIVESIADTKTYVDNHIPEDIVLKGDIFFVTPEMFGAVGDETTDDTTAINACFTYAISHKIDVRGKGIYRVSQPITLTADRMNIDLYQLSSWTTFTGYLLTIVGSRNNISFDTFQSTHSKGLLLTNSESKESRNNRINIGYLLADGDGLTIESAAASYISYNTFNINRIKSYSGNCIVNGVHATENQFYNTQLEAENGWGVYGTGSGKYYSLCMEETLLNGIYCKHMDGGEFHGCRHSELTTKLMNRLDNTRPNTTGGTLIKIVGGTGSIRYESNQQVPYMGVDVSDAWEISDTRYDEDLEHEYNPILHRVQAHRGCTQILAPIVHYTYSGAYGGLTIADSMIVIGNKKVCRPFCENKYTVVDADFDMRDSLTPHSGKPYPTKFVIGVASCVIHLPSSYCCAGFNRIIVDQSDATKLCTIYDDYSDTAIFNGSTLGAGVYELKALHDVDTIDPVYSEDLGRDIQQYTGNNGVWEIRRIDTPNIAQVSGDVYQMNL